MNGAPALLPAHRPILAADMVGYSRLMGTVEAAALTRLKSHRSDLIDPLLAEHGGRPIKLMGDGVLTEFPSVVAVVERAANAALALDPEQVGADRLLGRIHPDRGQHDLAPAELARALATSPSDARSYEAQGDALMWSGDHAAAIASLGAAQKPDPATAHGDLGMVCYLEGRYGKAISVLTRSLPIERSPQASVSDLAALATSYAQSDDADARARGELARISPFFAPGLSVSLFRAETDRGHLRDGLAKAGIGS